MKELSDQSTLFQAIALYIVVATSYISSSPAWTEVSIFLQEMLEYQQKDIFEAA